ncbi:MAG TPA: glycosyltransferase [Gaiellaceae bacterium]|nr:glycosyltransferase [Gaiellaceae bacterium]
MTRRPRLIYVASSFPYGRNDTFFGPEVRELDRQGVELLVVPMRPRGELTTGDAARWSVQKPLLDREIVLHALAEALRAPRRTLSLLQLLLRSPAPKVLARNLAAFPKALWLARLARRWNADHIHAHWAGPPSTAGMLAARLSGVPWSFTAHATEIYANNLLDEKCRSAAFVRFVALAMMERARQAAPGVDESRWTLLRLGLELPAERPLPVNDPAVLLLAASFTGGKGHLVLLDAVRRLAAEGQRLEVWFAGTGPHAEETARHAHRLGLDEMVRFHGYVPNAEVLDWLASGKVDVVVLPSDSEGVPVSLIEALAYGVPAVGSGVGGVPELLGEGCGELVPPRDHAALAAALAGLLASPERRAGYARAGRARVERDFAVEGVVARLRELMGFGTGE